MFDVGRSMFDTQFFQYSEQTKSHISAASGQNSGQFNRERNYIFVINDIVSYEELKESMAINLSHIQAVDS